MKATRLSLFLLVTACGGMHVIGKDITDGGTPTGCVSGSCGADEICDFDRVCRKYCGSNYPNAVCPRGTACGSYICRESCSPQQGCANRGSCDSFQTTAAVVSVCSATACGAGAQACPQRYACVSGWCQQIGQLCPDGACAIAGQVCDNGSCYVTCGPNSPGTVCASGHSCQGSLCR